MLMELQAANNNIKPSFAKNTQYATKFFTSEVKRTLIAQFY